MTTPPLCPGFTPRAGVVTGLESGAFADFAVWFGPADFSLATGRAGVLAGAGRFAFTLDLRVVTSFLAEDFIVLTFALSMFFFTGRADAAFRASGFGAGLGAARREATTGRRLAGLAVAFFGRAVNFFVLLDFAAGMQRSSL